MCFCVYVYVCAHVRVCALAAALLTRAKGVNALKFAASIRVILSAQVIICLYVSRREKSITLFVSNLFTYFEKVFLPFFIFSLFNARARLK